MDHLPINHRLRPFWRVLAFLTGVYILVFGIVGFIQATSEKLGWFAQSGQPTVLFLKANPAFALLSIIVGAIVVLATFIGRNVDRIVNLVAGTIFILASMGMLALLRTDLNYLGFTVATCVISAILGLIMATSGLYGRVGSRSSEKAETTRRHGVIDPDQGTAAPA